MKYKIPKIKKHYNPTVCIMDAYCAQAQELNDGCTGGCAGIECSACLFESEDLTSEREQQFLQWEKENL